jgi:hypothetical protein
MTTMRAYARLFAEADERTRDVLDAAWAVSGETGVGSEFSAPGGGRKVAGISVGRRAVTQLRA